jgi:cytochrome c oxidase subunit 4
VSATGKTHEHAEPNYWMVWLSLAILTVVELLVAQVQGARAFVVFSLCALALVKAALVAAYFMHLKFEKYALILIVLSPLLLSGILYVGLVPDATTHLHWLAH